MVPHTLVCHQVKTFPTKLSVCWGSAAPAMTGKKKKSLPHISICNHRAWRTLWIAQTLTYFPTLEWPTNLRVNLIFLFSMCDIKLDPQLADICKSWKIIIRCEVCVCVCVCLYWKNNNLPPLRLKITHTLEYFLFQSNSIPAMSAVMWNYFFNQNRRRQFVGC